MAIDRRRPARPPGRGAGYQSWRDLLFLHWPVPADALRRAVPAGLEIDTYDGVAYVGVVAFAMERVRPWWLPPPLAFEFLETNVRTYVHLDGGRGPGVFFFSLDAASRLAVWAARATFGLPYHFARMRLERRSGGAGGGGGGEVEYEVERRSNGARFLARYETGPEDLGPSPDGTLDHFLLERYFLHLEHGGALFTGQVHHAPYPRRPVRALEVRDGLVAAAGLPAAPPGPPPLVHFSPGVDVEVFALRPAGRERRAVSTRCSPAST